MEEKILSSAAAFVEGGLQDACGDACSICLEDFCDSDPSTVCCLEWITIPFCFCVFCSVYYTYIVMRHCFYEFTLLLLFRLQIANMSSISSASLNGISFSYCHRPFLGFFTCVQEYVMMLFIFYFFLLVYYYYFWCPSV